MDSLADMSATDDPLARLGRLLDVSNDAIVSADPDQRIVLFNQGAERMFGYAAAEVLGRPLEMLLPTRFADTHRNQVAEFAAGPTAARLMGERAVVHGRRKDGIEFPAEVTISRSLDAGATYINAIVRDVTERKRIEEHVLALNHELEARAQAKTAELRATTQQLWQSAKLASVGELAASIAHELNNPLGTVSLRLETVLALTPADAPTRPLLAVIEQEVERMARLVGNLLQFSRHAPDQASTVDVCDEVRKAADLSEFLLRRRGVRVVHEFPPASLFVFADRQKLRQVLLNLYTNAGDAMPGGGTLTVTVRPAETADGRPAVRVEVADTGAGIPPEVLPRVMDPFFTTKDEGKGTGLGLAICRRIVQEHQGTIVIDSAVGLGTTVRIVLPVQDGANVRGLAD